MGSDKTSSQNRRKFITGPVACWIALLCLVVPMFGSYFFDDMFSSISHLFEDPSSTALGWDSVQYGFYASGYSVLCVFGGLIVCGMLLDKWGVRITGSIFVGMMLAGAALVMWAVRSGFEPSKSLKIAYTGCMFFGLGSEIAGTSVTRSIAKWFKHRYMALAMGLHLAIARLGTALALVLAPKLVPAHEGVYSLSETARPSEVGVGLIAVGVILWAIFVAMDARFDAESGTTDRVETSQEDKFRFSDVLKILTNRNFLLIGLLCVMFYSSIIAFKKFAGAILIPRFNVPADAAGWMVSMLPFSTVVLAPLFGLMVDRKGKGTRWMIAGALLALVAHCIMAFAPTGVPFFGYLSMALLGFGYSLVPAALWPSVPKIVPEKVLGTSYSLIYWIQNLGLLLFKMLAGVILGKAMAEGVGMDVKTSAARNVELMFVVLCVVAVVISFMLARSSDRNPSLGLDEPNK